MLNEIARARQNELLANHRRIEHRVALEQAVRLERMQTTVRVLRARLGLAPAAAS